LLHSEGLKNGLDIESKPFLALSVFCSGAVPSYSSRSQNTKFISLSQSLTFLFVLFYANGKATFALNKSPSIDKSSVAF